MEISKAEPGTFCWPELSTTDPEGAKAFYTSLLGWTAIDEHLSPTMTYTMLQMSGKNVGALYKLKEEQRSQGVPPNWMSYVSVESADETAKKITELGGKVLMEPFDVFDIGRMTVFQDPTGATLAIWQPVKRIGAQVLNEPGALCWTELATNNVDVAGKFYTEVFGWTANTQSMGGQDYTMFMKGDCPAGGMLQMDEKWGKVPPHWMVYFAVEDCDKSAEKVGRLGGKVCVPPTDIPTVGRFSVVNDPQGAVFSIIKLARPV